MRDIVFKAKRIDNGEWVEGGYVNKTDCYGMECDEHYIIDGTVTDMEGYGEHYLVDKDTICQFTGLTDKNGCKIWENDIVVDDVILGTVVWDVKNARFVINDINDDYQDYSDWWNEVGVIGDIFDDYELIGEQNG